MKWPTYPDYKASGVEWLGEVPTHWEIMPLTRVAAAIQTGPFGSQLHEGDYVENEIPVINPAHIANGSLEPSSRSCVDTETAQRLARHRLFPGDIVMARRGDIGRCAVVSEESAGWICGTGSLVLRLRDSDPRYFAAVFGSSEFSGRLELNAVGTTMLNLNPAIVGRMMVAVPPFREQAEIAEFMERTTARIDGLIAKKRELIERLKERRSALISRTVTRGLPADVAAAAGLDPDPPLKDSGVDWIGAIPEHWTTPPLYVRYEIVLGKMLDEKRITGELLLPYLRNVDVQWDCVNMDDLPEMDVSPSEYDRYTVKDGDLLVCEGGEVGRAAIYRGKSLAVGFQKALHRLRPLSSCEEVRFIYYTMVFASATGIFEGQGNPNTIIHLTAQQFRRYRFPTPPLDEQLAIVKHLDIETNKIDRLVSSEEKLIGSLEEFRSALITAAVTGKIDVRGWRSEAPSATPAAE